jgi:hypothetical protein
LHYADPANRVDVSNSLIFSGPPVPADQTWRVELKDLTKKSYSWQATYYLKTDPERQTPLAMRDVPSVILPKLPA